MRKEHVSHFIAIFCGIVIGALSAQSIADAFVIGKYFWFIGAFAGGTIAWIMVEPRKFFAGTKLASQYAWQQTSDLKSNLDVQLWKNIGQVYLAGLSMGATAYCLSLLPPYFGFKLPVFVAFVLTILLICFFLISGVILTEAILATILFWSKLSNRRIKELAEIFDGTMFYLSPIGFPFVLIIACFHVVRWSILVVRAAPKFTIRFIRFMRQFLPRFIRLLFLYTNHERRTASFVFAAVGASVGFFVGYLPIVALAGALLGVLEFELTRSLRDRMSSQVYAST